MKIGIRGISEVKGNLKRVDKNMEKGVAVGLKRGGLLIQRESQKIVPVDTGNLRAGAFTRAVGTGMRTVVSVGYTAYYGPFVHENLQARHKPGKQAKFLERPVREHYQDVVDIVAKAVGVAIPVGISGIHLTFKTRKEAENE